MMLHGVGKWRIASRSFFAWVHTVICDLNSRKLYCVHCKDELGGVECYAMKPVDCLMEAAADVIGPLQGAINTIDFVGNLGDNLIVPLGVPIA